MQPVQSCKACLPVCAKAHTCSDYQGIPISKGVGGHALYIHVLYTNIWSGDESLLYAHNHTYPPSMQALPVVLYNRVKSDGTACSYFSFEQSATS